MPTPFNDRRRQSAVNARHAAQTEKLNTVPEGHELVPEDQWDAHDGQKVYVKGMGQRTLSVVQKGDWNQYIANAKTQGQQVTKGHDELYKKPTGEPGLTSL